MQKIIFSLLGICLFSSVALAQTNVSYFHNSVRCRTCHKMEKWSLEAVKELPVVFESINTDEPENKHFLTDYGLYSKSVVVSDSQSGKWKNLDKVWNYVGNEQEFKLYIQSEVQNFMKDAK